MNESLDIFLRILSIGAQISIPVGIFFAGRSIARAQYIKSTQDAWNEFNKIVIANSDNIRVSKETFGFSWARESDDAFRKAYISFIKLNAFVTVYYGSKHGLLPDEYKDQNIDQLLSLYIKDEQFFELTQTRGYPPEFRDFCNKIKNSADKSQQESRGNQETT